MTSNHSPTVHFSLVYCVSTRAPLRRAGAGVQIQTVMQANEWTSVATSSYIHPGRDSRDITDYHLGVL